MGSKQLNGILNDFFTNAVQLRQPKKSEARKWCQPIVDAVVGYVKLTGGTPFERIRILRTGSYYEGTKVQEPDEFDYMLILEDVDLKETLADILQSRFKKPTGSPGDEIGKTNSDPVFSTQRIHPVACVLQLPTWPSLPFHVIMSMQDVQVEALLNIRCIVKGYHLCCFEVDVGEGFTANQKRGECGNAFQVVNHHGQLGHLQSELVDQNIPQSRVGKHQN